MNYNKKTDEIWRQCEPYIRKLCAYKLKSTPDYIDDCVQDVFLDLSEALSKGKTIEYPKAWLTKVANNKIKDIYSRNKKHAEKNVPYDERSFADSRAGVVYDDYFSIDEKQIPAVKEKVVNMLDEKERKLLCDRYELKKSVEVIAEENGISENNVYQKLFRLKQKTRMLIEQVIKNENLL